MRINLAVKPGSTIKNKTGSWRTFRPKIDLQKCNGCTICCRTCPEGAIDMGQNNSVKNNKINIKNLYPEVNYNFCKGDGICALECPLKAITMELDKK